MEKAIAQKKWKHYICRSKLSFKFFKRTRSSAGQSICLLSRRSQVRILSRSLHRVQNQERSNSPRLRLQFSSVQFFQKFFHLEQDFYRLHLWRFFSINNPIGRVLWIMITNALNHTMGDGRFFSQCGGYRISPYTNLPFKSRNRNPFILDYKR